MSKEDWSSVYPAGNDEFMVVKLPEPFDKESPLPINKVIVERVVGEECGEQLVALVAVDRKLKIGDRVEVAQVMYCTVLLPGIAATIYVVK